MKKALIFLAEGFEEMEAVTPLDLLRRAGVDAKFVSLSGNLMVTGSHGVAYRADCLFDVKEAQTADMLILPGGMPGSVHLQEDETLGKLLCQFHEEGKFVCAICAAPMVLGHLGILKGKKATIYPGMEDKLLGATPVAELVCTDGNVVTGRGPGAAVPFALTLVSLLEGPEKTAALKESIVYQTV
ncbi:DJ-1/PfpI family protein [Anaerotignum lactatifermentans]|uniref:DJ-1/PfpI family protein n=1 Tax=Anaerotignum lactatifermentans TaxID=160404 RepID=A0ABS2GBZ5_9FIRM|nr:DJ-1 family glyoxalase III [Anaerotignum lactatifermentans]MBM6830092.1 DJ-1/PfpI family protein [Anaerotignum lactatifermentans]MBM6878675.1 DJ-1/PfpI family protein [Anaerotignum lactatifermentans]MBM6951740.1 DJ-1/PfpI family protein [Anaerotignum lactatifermentans]